MSTPLLVFSHLRWNSVFQRPHHIMTRLARTRDVLYVEEPIPASGEPRLEVMRASSRLKVVQPHLPVDGASFGPRQERVLEIELRRFLAREGWTDFAAWLYTPMAVRIARALRPRAILYDCMDELASFLNAPPELRQRERDLLACADAVFTGGPSLYRAKRALHRSVHCFPSSVDVEHFASANGIADARDQAHLPRPRLGFFGVIDERMDLEILGHVARSRPSWAIILVGPVAKIERSALPSGANLRYLGQRSYQDLPSFLAGWDVCLMPFALNDATRHISPTKVLEYLAADRPVVSTSVPDVAEPYGNIVHLGDGPAGFLKACEAALGASASERARRRAAARRILARTSWDETVARMEAILRDVAGEPVGAGAALAAAAPERSVA